MCCPRPVPNLESMPSAWHQNPRQVPSPTALETDRSLPVDPLQAVIFDVDGTLANTERDGHRVAFNEGFCGGRPELPVERR